MPADAAFAKRMMSRSGSGFVERIAERSGSGFAERIAGRPGSGFAERIAGRAGNAFAQKVMDSCGVLFAGRIIAAHTQLGVCAAADSQLVLLKRQAAPSAESVMYRFLLRLSVMWQSALHNERKFYGKRAAEMQSLMKKLERRAGEPAGHRGLIPAYRELAVFHNIASVFVNRGSRPDLAKKAERELVKILSTEYFEGGRDREREHRERMVNKKQAVREEFAGTKRIVRTLEEQIREQRTLIDELQHRVLAAPRQPEPDMNKITGEVMKRMEREMHLERLRRGL